MSVFPTMPLLTDAFIADTSALTAEETGGLLMLMMCAWRRPDCDLPDDETLLQRWSRIDPRRWPKVRDRIMSFWNLKAGFWTHDQLLREHDFVNRKRRSQSANAKAKWSKTKETGDAVAEPNASQFDAPTPTPNITPYSPPKRGTEKPDENFEKFWSAYPSRGTHGNPRKPAAEKFQAAVRRGVDPLAIIRGAANYAAAVAREKTEPQFVAQAATWLRQERWADHLAPPPTATTKSRPQAADVPEFDLVRH
ncbi:DUF1376 domain-containing protein [Nitrospirillum bahiense]|uniref:Uncharacterized protein YdaU (DUF1376 family) n=1 Tax=Nitrospirillum amazonense TaxID=28077 RepID=A0A560FCA2_9PROT|nr:DUF1376 domain-containing protein [Nitrospirillum amazonense]TWB19210.1 uncharacterized protein YdaU (DUF1376 family) [Nitrospirillum amazonense]